MLFIGNNNIPVLATVQDIILLLQKVLHREGIPLLKDVIYPKYSGQDIVFTCPFHKNGNENKPSAGIMTKPNPDTKKVYFYCFTCHEKGTLETLVSRCFGYNDRGVFGTQWILNNFSSVLVENRSNAFPIPSRKKIEIKKETKYVSEEELDKYRYYCSYHYKRHLSNEMIDLYDIGYDANFKLGEAITFPVRDITGGCIFIARRTIHKKNYNYPAGTNKIIYGVYEAKKLFPNSKEVYICESMLNAISITQKLHKPALSLLGTGIKAQYEELKKLGYRTYNIALDGDKAGIRGSQKLKEALKYTGFVHEIRLPEVRDINDLAIYDDETFAKILNMYTKII